MDGADVGGSPPRRRAVEAVDLWWLPLGSGTSVVAGCGRAYEALCAARQHRRRLALYHTALELLVGGRRVVVELAPVAVGDPAARGAVREGPVGSRVLGRLRAFRYEVRCWPDGTIPDAGAAVASPQRVSEDPLVIRRLLELAPLAPPLVWSRDQLRAGEMWTSNSVIAWLLASSGVPATAPALPPGGRAPGWDAGVELARRQAGAGAGPTGIWNTGRHA